MTAHFVHLLDQLKRRIARMAAMVQDMLQEANEAVSSLNHDLARRVIERDTDVDEEEVEIEADVIRLFALYQPVGSDLRLLCTILKINNDLERIADCTVNMAERALHLREDVVHSYQDSLQEMGRIVHDMLKNAMLAFSLSDVETAKRTFSEDDKVDAYYGRTIRRIVAEGADSPDETAAQLDILSVAKNLERIADHATNIAEDVVFLSTGRIVRHIDILGQPSP